MDLNLLSGVFANPANIIKSLIDISIIAYIFYRLLRVIRGTKAEQLLKGLIVLLVFSVVSIYLQLDMINWLMEKLWIIFAITIPIVFQPELRRILEQLGRGSFFASQLSKTDWEDYKLVFQEINKATSILSRNKIGALIVISREADISEFLDSGIYIDSVVSSPLLLNVFSPNSPLHDGAVIIKNGRLEKAASFLPLSDNPHLDQKLGTRHRAALGITEVSDAIAVIVSEENGRISLAREGMLKQNIDEKELEDNLMEEYIERFSWKETFRRKWVNNNGKEKE